MKETVETICQKDGYLTRLFYYTTTKEQVQGTVLLLHGMAEHHGRYHHFIRHLTEEGFDVFTYDHRGHGTDKKISDLGYFARKDGASLVVSDAIQVCNYIKTNGRSSKLAIFGHSMGSLILRCMIQQYHDLSCVVVSSTTVPPVAISNVGLLLSRLLCLFHGAKTPSPFLNKTLFGGPLYNNLCSRTAYDWLTRNNTLIENYINDPYCGFVCTTSFYHDLIKLSKQATQKRNIKKTEKDLPILFLTGSKDPVGGYTKGVIRLHKTHEQLGFSNTSLIIYEEARHELLNELCAEEVMQDIAAFFRKHFN